MMTAALSLRAKRFAASAGLAGVMAAGCAVPAHADLTGGVWHRGDGNARVRISSCGPAFCAVNVWIKNPGDEKVGDRLIMNVKQTAPGRFSGTSFDPQRNLRFSTQIRLNGNSMTTSGCILGGIICRSQQWTRR